MFSARAYIQPSRSPLIQAAARLRDMTGSLLDPGGPRPSGVHRLLLRPDDPVHARARAGTGHLQRLQRLLVLGQAIVRGPAPRSARGDLAMVKRGPVRGPSHPCEQCNQGHRRHGSVVSVQVAHPERRAVLLIIRRSWVRAPPAPPAVIRYIRCRPWTDAGGIAYRQIGLPGQHLPSPDLAAARTGPNPAAIPANPQAPLWRSSGQDSPAPHRSGVSRAAGFSYTAEQRPGTAERQKTHSGAISGGDCA